MRASRVPPNTIFVYLRVLERVSDVLRTSRGRKRYPARTAFTTFSDIPRPPRSQHHDQAGFERALSTMPAAKGKGGAKAKAQPDAAGNLPALWTSGFAYPWSSDKVPDPRRF